MNLHKKGRMAGNRGKGQGISSHARHLCKPRKYSCNINSYPLKHFPEVSSRNLQQQRIGKTRKVSGKSPDVTYSAASPSGALTRYPNNFPGHSLCCGDSYFMLWRFLERTSVKSALLWVSISVFLDIDNTCKSTQGRMQRVAKSGSSKNVQATYTYA